MHDLKLRSNGKHNVVGMPDGSASSRCDGMAVTRWVEDAALVGQSGLIFLQTTDHFPSVRSTSRSVRFDELPLARAHWRKSRHLWTSPLRATLRSSTAACGLRTFPPTPFFYATSFAEVVLSPAATDAAHPAFSKLFLESEIDESLSAILVTRRPSVPKDGQPWLFSVARCNQAAVGNNSFETDRMRFVRARPGLKGGFCDTARHRLLCSLACSRLRLRPKRCPECRQDAVPCFRTTPTKDA